LIASTAFLIADAASGVTSPSLSPLPATVSSAGLIELAVSLPEVVIGDVSLLAAAVVVSFESAAMFSFVSVSTAAFTTASGAALAASEVAAAVSASVA